MSEELVRCPSCRGRKQVEKLGGVLGDCNTCVGEGKIKLCDKPLPPLSQHDAVYGDKNVIDAVSKVMPNPIDHLESEASRLLDDVIVEPVIQIETKSVAKKVNASGKRAVFKRKVEG